MEAIDALINAINQFLEEERLFFFNERDLQMKLAVYLMQKKYKVEVEYRITKADLQNGGIYYPWEEDVISIDLVLEFERYYIPIEIKYKTRAINKDIKTFTRFGENVSAEDIVKNQSAQDLGRYGFWKDVKRLELIKARYKQVVGGIALFVTNDESYKINPKPSKKDVGYYNFRMIENETISGKLQWQKDGKVIDVTGPCRNFELENEYTINSWKQYTANIGETMHYTLLKI